MAATKKNEAIRAEKQALVDQIMKAEESLTETLRRVPDHIINGSHQVAVQWKAEAERALNNGLGGGWTSMNKSLDKLRQMKSVKERRLQFLTGATKEPA